MKRDFLNTDKEVLNKLEMDKSLGKIDLEEEDWPDIKAAIFTNSSYKDFNSYKKEDTLCYIPENSNTIYTKEDFLELARGFDDLADYLFEQCFWQHPSTIMDELEDNTEILGLEKYTKVFGPNDDIDEFKFNTTFYRGLKLNTIVYWNNDFNDILLDKELYLKSFINNAVLNLKSDPSSKKVIVNEEINLKDDSLFLTFTSKDNKDKFLYSEDFYLYFK